MCDSPLKGFWSKKKHPVTHRHYVVFNTSDGYIDRPVMIPCGKCIKCRLAKSYQWSMRCTCESYFHKENYFLTLTYDKEHLPADRCLNRVHFQQFMKRLRWHFRGYKLKVFYCGEYGEKRHRPHYHAIVFGLPLAEKGYKLYPLNYSSRHNVNYCNDTITRLWSQGLVTIGSFSSASASYVAQYTLKKAKWEPGTGKSKIIRKAVPEFIGMSLKTPIGFEFFCKYWRQIFNRGGQLINDAEKTFLVPPLRFFKRQLEKFHPFEHWKYVIKAKRRYLARLHFARTFTPDKFAQKLDKEIRNRIIREERLNRQLKERSDLF